MKASELRNAVLQLAVQGKLVPQNPADEPASVLLEKIKAEKEQLIKGKKIKQDKPLSKITDEEKPFEIPENWEWVRLGEILQFINGDRGKNYPSKNKLSTEGIPFVSAINIQNGTISSKNLLCLTQEQYDKLGSGKLNKNDMVFCIRGSLGKNGIYQFESGAIASSLVILRQYEYSNTLLTYLNSYINAPILFAEIKKFDNGTAQPNLSAENLKNFLFPLPPLAEQQRIVAKIEEILPKIDMYEKMEIELSTLEKAIPDNLRKSILQLAVQGKLVPQNPADEPASVLLEKIKAEKEQLIKEKKTKPKKSLPEITDEEIPYEIPDSWQWVRLGIIAHSTDAGKSPDCIEKPAQGDEWGVIKTTAIQCNIFKENENKLLPNTFKISDSYIINEGDVLITRAGPKNRVGIVCCVEKITKKIILSDKTIRLKLSERLISHNYISFALNSPSIRVYIEAKMTGMAESQVNISQNNMLSFPIPFPPLAEQQRIVQKIDELMALCTQLEKTIKKI